MFAVLKCVEQSQHCCCASPPGARPYSNRFVSDALKEDERRGMDQMSAQHASLHNSDGSELFVVHSVSDISISALDKAEVMTGMPASLK